MTCVRVCFRSRGGRGVFNDDVCVCLLREPGFFCCPACAEGQSPPPPPQKKKHACAFFPDSRPHVSERKKDPSGPHAWSRRSARAGWPWWRRPEASNRSARGARAPTARYGRLLERHRQDAAHLPLRRVRRVPPPARGPGGEAVQMGADAAARTKRPRYKGAPLAAATCTARIGALLSAGGRCVVRARRRARRRERHLHGRGGGAGYDDGSAQVLCQGCQRFFNDLDAAARRLTRAVVANAREARPSHPLAALPVEFECSVLAKLRQMKQREVATDRPSRGAPVELDALRPRRLCHWGLAARAQPRAHPNTLVPPLALLTRADIRLAPPSPPRSQASATNVPLSEPNSAFTWSFDRVVAGEAYTEAVQPVLHHYNDAKYIWSDTSAREWLDGLCRRRPDGAAGRRRVVVGARARARRRRARPAPMRRVVIDRLEEGAEAARPILLD